MRGAPWFPLCEFLRIQEVLKFSENEDRCCKQEMSHHSGSYFLRSRVDRMIFLTNQNEDLFVYRKRENSLSISLQVVKLKQWLRV